MKENFDRFNFANYKEKEMADFRRWITALAVIALFVGLASAQVGIPVAGGSSAGTFTCALQNVTVTPNLRSEGYTEQTGDIVIICSGGSPLALGTQIPTVNIQVYYNTAVTSRLLSGSTSEALLMIDEPNDGALGSQIGYGPAVGQILCSSASYGAGPNGCVQYVGTSQGVGGYLGQVGVPVAGSAASTTPGANVFQGVVTGQSVTFAGIPVLPPVTTGASRVFRITNVRVNANAAGGGLAGVPGQITASIAVSGATSLPITIPNTVVGFVAQGLKSSVGGAVSFNQCNSSSGFAALLNFTEGFGTAFKTRVDGFKGGLANNIGTTGAQNVPGVGYNSESNFIANGTNQGSGGVVSGGGWTAGLADFGTRLKAVFTNVPAGATVYVSTTNVLSNNNGIAGIIPAPNPASNTTGSSYAVLIQTGSENSSDGTGAGAAVPTASATNSFTVASTSGNASAGVNYVAATATAGNPIEAIWEVVNTQPSFVETISFSVWIAYTASATSPPTGNSQVAFSFAPNATNNSGFSATGASSASSSMPIPRFVDSSGTTGNPIGNFFAVNLCQTVLLFPYITTVTGFDTGISIANTTTDPFKTVNQAGTCTLYWYQGTGNPPPTTTASVASGTVTVLQASAAANAGPNFTGYSIAVCNFQLAHGFAVVTDYGAQKILSVYLALVVPTGTASRNISSGGTPEQLNN